MAHSSEEEKKEYFDTEEELEKKVSILAELVKKSRHFIVFTGAGISTSAGIPDFRSGVNTVLPTGPGAWEKLATKTGQKGSLRANTISAIPTLSHMSLVKLEQEGILKFLISQNTDGLHRRSGFSVKKLAELHGNVNLEKCRNPKCLKQYFRDFRTRSAVNSKSHETGRLCENCGEMLHDSIINFGENLPQEELEAGFENAEQADLCLCLGSSLRVTPAADMPRKTAARGGKLVIVNLQPTPLDKDALRINGFIDDIMSRLMKKLDLEIPQFTLKRRVVVSVNDKDPKTSKKLSQPSLFVDGCDESGAPYSLFKKVEAYFTDSKEGISLEKEPFIATPKKSEFKDVVKLRLTFQGHYHEPPFEMEIPVQKFQKNVPRYYKLEFDPKTDKWLDPEWIMLSIPDDM